jgi:hypothetical protein
MASGLSTRSSVGIASEDPTVIAFDPGSTTGWAIATVHPEAFTEPEVRVMDNILHFAFGEFFGTEYRIVLQMVELWRGWPGAACVIEDFILDPSKARIKSRELLSPVRITAGFKFHSLEAEVPTTMQLKDYAFRTITDERLAAAGYFEQTAGMKDARAAVKHLLTFLKRLKKDRALLARTFPHLVESGRVA